MTPQAAPDPSSDPTLAVAERQLVLLGELAEIAMAAARAFGSSAVVSAEAEKRILADEYFVPEIGRARACGAKDAAESFQKASRAVRLTLKLQMAIAEIVRDIRAGIVTHTEGMAHQENAGETLADQVDLQNRQSPPRPLSRGLAGFPSDAESRDRDRRDLDSDRLVEFECPDRLPYGSFRELMEGLCAEIGVAPDWVNWSVGRQEPNGQPLAPKPPGRSKTRPGPSPPRDFPSEADRPARPPP